MDADKPVSYGGWRHTSLQAGRCEFQEKVQRAVDLIPVSSILLENCIFSFRQQFDPRRRKNGAYEIAGPVPKSFMAKGAALYVCAIQHNGPFALVELFNGPNPSQYVAGTENFYAITRYNWSNYYAMAVIELAEAVAREMPNKR